MHPVFLAGPLEYVCMILLFLRRSHFLSLSSFVCSYFFMVYFYKVNTVEEEKNRISSLLQLTGDLESQLEQAHNNCKRLQIYFVFVEYLFSFYS